MLDGEWKIYLKDIRAEHVDRAGGEEAVEAGKQELLATVLGHRLAEVRRARQW